MYRSGNFEWVADYEMSIVINTPAHDILVDMRIVMNY